MVLKTPAKKRPNTNDIEYSDQSVECSTPNCQIWTSISVPKDYPQPDNFCCGFCSAKVILKLEQEKDSDQKKILLLEQTQMETIKRAEEEPRTQPEPRMNYAQAAKGIAQEQSEQKKRALNVIIRGTKPVSPTMDRELVLKIAEASKTTLTNEDIKEVKRVGNKGENEYQLLLVVMKDEKTKWKLIAASKALKQTSEFEHVFINPNLTRNEQEQQHMLRKKLKETRDGDKAQNYKIYRGNIIKC